MKRRTKEEIEAYIDGYNACFEQFMECITCPKLSLETHTMYFNDGTTYKVHQCEHIDFCKTVRKNWEKYHKAERKEE